MEVARYWAVEIDPIKPFNSQQKLSFSFYSHRMHRKHHHPSRSDIDHNVEANADENCDEEASSDNA